MSDDSTDHKMRLWRLARIARLFREWGLERPKNYPQNQYFAEITERHIARLRESARAPPE